MNGTTLMLCPSLFISLILSNKYAVVDKKRQFLLILHQRRNLFLQNVLCPVEERWGVVRSLRAFVRLVDVVLLVVLRIFGYDVQRRHLRFCLVLLLCV